MGVAGWGTGAGKENVGGIMGRCEWAGTQRVGPGWKTLLPPQHRSCLCIDTWSTHAPDLSPGWCMCGPHAGAQTVRSCLFPGFWTTQAPNRTLPSCAPALPRAPQGARGWSPAAPCSAPAKTASIRMKRFMSHPKTTALKLDMHSEDW